MNHLLPSRQNLRRAALVLLQADRPAPVRNDQEVAAEVAANYRWNLAANLLDGLIFWFGMSFISSSTIIPLFISKLTPSPLAIGLAAVIAQGGWFLPQLFTANAVERLSRKKPVVINLGFFLERLPVLLLVLAAWLALESPTLALVVFFIGHAWRGLGGGAVATAWQDLIARCFPVERRGRFMGTANFLGTGAGALGAGLSTWLLATYPFSINFVYVFGIAAASLGLSWFFLSLTREPVRAVTTPRQSNRQFLAGLPKILGQDHNFRRFLAARCLIALGGLGTGFVTVAAIQRWQIPDSTVGLYTAAFWLGQAMGNPAFGLLADRFGHKLSLELGTAASALAFALAWLAPAPGYMFAVFWLSGITTSALIGSGILVALEFSGPERRPTYAGLANTIVGLVNMAAPLLGAWLALLGYEWVFAVSAAVNLLALVTMHYWVREPRFAPPSIVSAKGQP
jgi:MFS family permease